jgi:transcriptional regulator with XRE-family HTH domain
MMNKPKIQRSPVLQKLQQGRSATAFEKTKKQMLLAAKIQDGIKAKGLNNTQFAVMMDQHASVISKWVSGTHNFTTDTLFDIEEKLGIGLVALSEPKPKIIVKEYVAVVKSSGNVKYEHLPNTGNTKIDRENNIRIKVSLLQPNHNISLPIFNTFNYEC